MRHISEWLSQPQTAGFDHVDFFGVNGYEILIGFAASTVAAGAVWLWAPYLIAIAFTLIYGLFIGIAGTLIGMVYLDSHPPRGWFVAMPNVRGFDRGSEIHQFGKMEIGDGLNPNSS